MPRTSSSPVFDHDRLQAEPTARSRPRRRDNIRPCCWHCRFFSMISSARRPSKAITPGVAQRDLALVRAGIGMLADRHQPVALHQEPAVAGRVGGAEGRARREPRRSSAAVRRRSNVSAENQRRIAERDQEIIGSISNRIACGEHRMRGCRGAGAARRFFASTRSRATSSATAWWSGPMTTAKRGARAFGRGIQHMRQQRLAGDLMQEPSATKSASASPRRPQVRQSGWIGQSFRSFKFGGRGAVFNCFPPEKKTVFRAP